MEFFDEIQELEIVELIDRRNELLNELEYGVDSIREDEIQNEFSEIYEKLDLLY